MLKRYMNDLVRAIRNLDRILFHQILFQLRIANKNRKSIFLAGNGMNTHSVNHFANDLIKVLMCHDPGNSCQGYKVFSLSESMPIVSAFANDIDFQSLYSAYLSRLAVAGDILMIFESAIPHGNLMNAARYGHENNLKVIAVTGAEKGGLEAYCDILLSVPASGQSGAGTVQNFICHSLVKALKASLNQPVVFLDRDGVINTNRDDYVKSWKEFSFIEGAPEAVSMLNDAGYAVVIVTNQSAIARKKLTTMELEAIHRKMVEQLQYHNAKIAEIYYCPHHPDDLCDCRKPKSGLISNAFRDFPLERQSAVVIGDRYSDIQAGQDLGLQTILISDKAIPDGKADLVKPSLYAAARYILEKNELSHDKLVAAYRN